MNNAFDDMDDLNPFVDPSVVAASKAQQNKPAPAAQTTFSPKNETFEPALMSEREPVQPLTQPTWVAPSFQPTQSSTYETGNLTSELDKLRQREMELNKREQELAQREVVMGLGQGTQNARTGRENNFPPLPSWFPIKPCFYINIEEEIPAALQPLMKKLRLKLFVYSAVLFINIIALSFQLGSPVNGSTGAFVISIILCFVFIPGSFFFVFRSAYMAFKSNSSFYFVVYFGSCFVEIICHAVQLLGFQGNSYAGFINGAFCIDNGYVFAGSAGIIMGIVYMILFFATILLGREVHKIYKSGGGNIAQAQNEFTSGLWRRAGPSLFQPQQNVDSHNTIP